MVWSRPTWPIAAFLAIMRCERFKAGSRWLLFSFLFIFIFFFFSPIIIISLCCRRYHFLFSLVFPFYRSFATYAQPRNCIYALAFFFFSRASFALSWCIYAFSTFYTWSIDSYDRDAQRYDPVSGKPLMFPFDCSCVITKSMARPC